MSLRPVGGPFVYRTSKADTPPAHDAGKNPTSRIRRGKYRIFARGVKAMSAQENENAENTENPRCFLQEAVQSRQSIPVKKRTIDAWKWPRCRLCGENDGGEQGMGTQPECPSGWFQGRSRRKSRGFPRTATRRLQLVMPELRCCSRRP